MKTDFDQAIGKINIVPQDIGRVILNFINNAFYAVNEKQKQNLNGYEPTVTVATTKRDGRVEIRVKDNGNGIPQKVLDKIFQPFFTTKPTGQGTGLGLSLAYDIVKAHGGEIKVNTQEGEFTEFVVQLPISLTVRVSCFFLFTILNVSRVINSYPFVLFQFPQLLPSLAFIHLKLDSPCK